MDRKFSGLENKDEILKKIDQMKDSFKKAIENAQKTYIKWLDDQAQNIKTSDKYLKKQGQIKTDGLENGKVKGNDVGLSDTTDDIDDDGMNV